MPWASPVGTSCGTGALKFSSTGTLPPGLTLSSAGVLSGTPTSPGAYHFTVTASDSLLAPSYITTLDDPSAIPGSTYAYGISGSNIVGTYADHSGDHGFLYNGFTWTTLDDPGATGGTNATGISGDNIVGYYSSSSGTHGFLYNGTTWTTLKDPNAGLEFPPRNGTFPLGISGTNIVGTYDDRSGELRGFL